MDWKNFAPDEAKAEALRPLALALEGMNPYAPMVPIRGITPNPRWCNECHQQVTPMGFCNCPNRTWN